MKAYLFLFLIGIALSIDCVKYITTKKEGTVSNLLVTKKCVCQIYFRGIMSDYGDSCTCFMDSELTQCENDPKCETAPSIGCRNK